MLLIHASEYLTGSFSNLTNMISIPETVDDGYARKTTCSSQFRDLDSIFRPKIRGKTVDLAPETKKSFRSGSKERKFNLQTTRIPSTFLEIL